MDGWTGPTAQCHALRLLVVSPILPHPGASHGGAVYLGSLVEGFCQHAQVALIACVKPSEVRWGSEPPAGLAEYHGIPFPQNRDLGTGARIGNMARLAWRWGFGRLPLLAAKIRLPGLVQRIRSVNADFRPDVVLLEFGLMAQFAREFQGPAVVLTDHEHGEALPDRLGPLGLGLLRDRALWRRYVWHHYRQAHLVQALNQVDAVHLSRAIGRPVEVRPPAVPIPAEPVHPERSRPAALFLGDYSHHPNAEAAIYLARMVFPAIRARLKDAELLLAGPRAPEEVKQLARIEGVRLLGYVEDLEATFHQARLLLAPLFSGGGSRIKVLTALAHGLPVVSNQLGLRGVAASPPGVASAETPEDLVRAALRLLTDTDAAARAGASAREFACLHLGADGLARQQLERFEALLGSR